MFNSITILKGSMADTTIAGLFTEAAKRLRADFEYVRITNPHQGEKGEEVESVLKTFLNAHLPQRFRAGSGIVIDFENNLSRQMDVIVYDALTSPIYRAAEKTQIIPAHTVAAVIEVKTSLNKGELEDAYKKIASCKQLKKPQSSSMDQPSTQSGLDSLGTMGIVFGFDADTSLETLGDNARGLNAEYESFLWPDMIVVLDRGVLTYTIQWPGAHDKLAGWFAPQPPVGHDRVSPPPWYVHLAAYRDGEVALNRFFLGLLAHLTFFPYRHGTPTFKEMVGKQDVEVLTIRGYQFNRARQLLPAPPELFGEGPKPLRMNLRGPDNALLGVLQYFRWQDGAVVRKYGPFPLEGLLPLVHADPEALVLHDPSKPGMQITTILALDEAVFREWPAMIAARSNLHAEIVEPGHRNMRPLSNRSRIALVAIPNAVKGTSTDNSADPFVVAVAVVRPATVVSRERAGSPQRPKIPYLCVQRGVPHQDTGAVVTGQG